MTSYTWDILSGEWATNGDWSLIGAPTSSDDASLSNGGTITVSSTDISAVAAVLTVSDGALTVDGQLNVDDLIVSGSGSVTVNGGILETGVRSLSGNPTYNEVDTALVENFGILQVGNDIKGAVSGTVTLAGGGEYKFDDAVASDTSGNTVDFTSTGGSFEVQQVWGGTIDNFNTSTSNKLVFSSQISNQSFDDVTNILTVTAGAATYHLNFADNGQALSASNFSNGAGGYSINYTGAVYQQISGATYNATTGILTVTGHDLSTSTSAYNVGALTISGEDGVSYTLTAGSSVGAGPTSTGFTVTLSAADRLAVDGLLNKNGTTSQEGQDFGLSAAANFVTGGSPVSDATVNELSALAPTLTSVVYNRATGALTLTGTGLENEGTTYGVNAEHLKITGGSNQTYTLAADDDLASSSTSVSFKLSGDDLLKVNEYLDQNGSTSKEGTAYNLAATIGWDSEVGAAITTEAITVTCFASGTRIRTSRGDVAVEELQVGDLAMTASGNRRPIRWIGHRRVHCRRHPVPHEVMPIRIAAHAFGPSRPTRDLYVSPGHAICVDVLGEALIPAIALVNGATIQQVGVEEVTYWHVELDSHDILMAENLPAESYFDTGNRGFFAESELVQLHVTPEDAVRAHENFCRPFHDSGALVDAVRFQLGIRAQSLGWTLQQGDLDLHLLVDGRRVDPILRGRRARFHLSGAAREVWLASSAARPIDVGHGADHRILGVCVAGLRVGADLTRQCEIQLDDPALRVGFYGVERDGERIWRWTAGRARLPVSLLADGSERLLLTVELAGEGLPRWAVSSNEWGNADAYAAVSA